MSDEEEVKDEELPNPPAHFITISYDEDGEVILDIGDIDFFKARGIMEVALDEMKSVSPNVHVKSTDAVFFAAHPMAMWIDDDEDDEDDDDANGG